MKRVIKPGEYARQMRKAMQAAIDPATGEPLKLRGLERMTREQGRQYSYEHLRKMLSGEPVHSEECNEVVCKLLGLDTAHMWEIAQAEKAVRRYGPVLRMASPDDGRMRDIWAQLHEDERDRIIQLCEGLVAQRELNQSLHS